ncbi:MAG: glycosyltransferase family 4 protein [Ignavibacteria bacterium]
MKPEKGILHIVWQMDIGGAERAVYQLVREQNRNFINADILIINQKGFYGAKCELICNNVYSLNANNFPNSEIRNRFKNICRKYDKVHFHSVEFVYMILISKLKDIEKYYTHRAGIHNFTLKKRIRHKIAGYYLRKYFKKISANTFLGAKAASKIFKIPLEEICVTYNGIDFELLKEEIDRNLLKKDLGIEGEIIIGSSANIRIWKRLDKIVYLMNKLKNNNVKAIIVGDGPCKSELIKLAEELNLKDRIIFIDKTNNIADYLQIMDIFILPSDNSESFGNSAVEALGWGIPTFVYSDGGGLTEHIINNETGFIVKSDEELLEKVKLLINDKNLRDKIGENGRHHVRSKYNLTKMISNYNKFYDIE